MSCVNTKDLIDINQHVLPQQCIQIQMILIMVSFTLRSVETQYKALEFMLYANQFLTEILWKPTKHLRKPIRNHVYTSSLCKLILGGNFKLQQVSVVETIWIRMQTCHLAETLCILQFPHSFLSGSILHKTIFPPMIIYARLWKFRISYSFKDQFQQHYRLIAQSMYGFYF